MLVPHCSHYDNTEPAPFNPGARKRDRAGAGGRDGAGRRRAGHGSGYHGPFRIKTEHGLAARCAAAASPLRALLAPGETDPPDTPRRALAVYLLYEPKSYSSSGTASPDP